MKRVAAVTGGLMVVGGIAGGLATALAVAGVVLVSDPSELLRDPELFFIAGAFGAVYGAVLGPLAAWLLMRHVPLGIAIGGTMLGTLVGGVLALTAMEEHILTLPLVGFFLAALAIRLLVPRPARVKVQG
jgi:hypothetical protein